MAVHIFIEGHSLRTSFRTWCQNHGRLRRSGSAHCLWLRFKM